MLECAVEGCEVLYDDFFGVIPFLDASEDQVQNLPRLEIEGLPLNNSSVVYYYVYGSVLAAFNECDSAEVILTQLEDTYGADDTIMAIVDESRTVCRVLQEDDS